MGGEKKPFQGHICSVTSMYLILYDFLLVQNTVFQRNATTLPLCKKPWIQHMLVNYNSAS